MRTTRKRLFLLAITALLATTAFSPVRADARLRSGTIISGTGGSPANFWVRGMEGCVGAPACSAWLQSACGPALARKDPALHASIVSVGGLADGVSERVLNVRGGVGVNWGYFIVQFWTGSETFTRRPCSEILSSRTTSWECDDDREWPNPTRVTCKLPIPRHARWMTITSSPDNTDLNWALS